MVVHWEQQGLKAKSETDGHGDTCGPIIILDYMHLKDPANWPLTNERLDVLRQDLINHGWMQPRSGMTIAGIAAGFEHYGVKPVKVVTYQATLSFEQFHSDLISALEQHQLVCEETSKAYKLPGNQAGVEYHFVLFGGIDSNLGYLTANGDEYRALAVATYVDPDWYGIGPIQASEPCGYIILPALDASAPTGGNQLIAIERDGNGNITGAKDDTNGNTVLGGFAATIENNNWESATIAVPETPLGGVSVAVVRGAAKAAMTYSQSAGVHTYNGDIVDVVQSLYEEKQAPAPQPPAPVAHDYTQQFNDVDKALGSLHAALAANGEVK